MNNTENRARAPRPEGDPRPELERRTRQIARALHALGEGTDEPFVRRIEVAEHLLAVRALIRREKDYFAWAEMTTGWSERHVKDHLRLARDADRIRAAMAIIRKKGLNLDPRYFSLAHYEGLTDVVRALRAGLPIPALPDDRRRRRGAARKPARRTDPAVLRRLLAVALVALDTALDCCEAEGVRLPQQSAEMREMLVLARHEAALVVHDTAQAEHGLELLDAGADAAVVTRDDNARHHGEEVEGGGCALMRTTPARARHAGTVVAR